MKSDLFIADTNARAEDVNALRDDARASSYLLAHEQSTPDLTLQVEAGNVYFGSTLVEFAGGNSPSFTAPTTNPRIDILTLKDDGDLNRVEGTEGASPTAPAIPAGQIPIAQVFNRVGQTSIKDEDDSSNGYTQKDLRPFLSRDIEHVGGVEVSDTLRHSNDDEVTTASDTYFRVKEIEVTNGFKGVIRFKWRAWNGSSGSATGTRSKVYLNGVGVGVEQSTANADTPQQKTDDVIMNVKEGDKIQLYLRRANDNANAFADNFRLYFDYTNKYISKILYELQVAERMETTEPSIESDFDFTNTLT